MLEDATICFLDKQTVLSMLRRHAGIALRILKTLGRDLRVAEQRTLDLIRKPVADRVAALLLDLQRAFGEPAPRGIRLCIALTREEMAEMIGTTSETLIRTLSEFRARGLIDLAPHRITIRDPAGLTRPVPAPG